MALFHFERRVFRHLHWGLLLCMVSLTLIGIAAIAWSENPGEAHAPRQAVWMAISLAAFVLAVAIDPPWLRWLAPLIYIALLGALVALLIRGQTVKGAASWYSIGGTRVQPSEFMKIAVVLLLSDLAARRPGSWSTLPGLALPIFLVAVAAAIIFKQPDLGTAAVFLPVLFALLLAGGARIRHLVLLGMLGLASAGLMFEHLEPYQRERLASFLHPESDIRGRDYNIYQARITLGSGQLWGRAFAEESEEGDIEDPLAPASSPAEFSRARLDFLPEAHTDFIFSSLGEQFGFVGCSAVIALYVLFTLFAVIVAIQARTLQGAVMVVGLLSIVLTHVVLNLGMCLSLLPVTGLPLPFVSYGGSSMLTNYVIGGLICNVAARRYEFETTRV